jgi:DNA ligase-1
MIYLNEGDFIFVKGSAKEPYKIRKVGSVIDCSCPSWRNQSKNIDARTCKHILKNIDPLCILPQALANIQPELKYTKTGKVSTAVGGVVVKEGAPPVLLAHAWKDEDVTGWWISVKMDGVRAWWDGKNFISRLGNIYHAPTEIIERMPKDIVLDGELWVGAGQFQKTISAVRKLVPNEDEWSKVNYVVFDAPKISGTFEDRMKVLRGLYPTLKMEDNEPAQFISIAEQIVCRSTLHLKELLKEVEALGGEGVMLREPRSFYIEGRSKSLLKVKSFFDAEAKVVGHSPGRGKHKGRLGALQCQMPSGVTFEVGSGFTDKERENPPKIGSTITYKFQELTSDKVPRFPVFLSARDYE